jgi:hypothetical protein
MIPKSLRIVIAGLLILVAIAVIVEGAGAVQVTESPDHIQNGDTVTLQVSGLPDNATFSLAIQGTFMVSPGSGSAFTFETDHFVMPFTLNDGKISASITNAQKAFLNVRKGDQSASVGKNSIPDGRFTYAGTQTIPAGTYDSLGLSGNALDSTQPITTSFQLTGTKSGPADAEISFILAGIDAGTVQVTALVDNRQVFSKEITVGTPASTPTETPTVPLDTLPVLAGIAGALFLYKCSSYLF